MCYTPIKLSCHTRMKNVCTVFASWLQFFSFSPARIRKMWTNSKCESPTGWRQKAYQLLGKQVHISPWCKQKRGGHSLDLLPHRINLEKFRPLPLRDFELSSYRPWRFWLKHQAKRDTSRHVQALLLYVGYTGLRKIPSSPLIHGTWKNY